MKINVCAIRYCGNCQGRGHYSEECQMPSKNCCMPCLIDDKPCPNMSNGKICSPLKDLCPTHEIVNIDDSEELVEMLSETYYDVNEGELDVLIEDLDIFSF
jgi:hypothetical protein